MKTLTLAVVDKEVTLKDVKERLEQFIHYKSDFDEVFMNYVKGFNYDIDALDNFVTHLEDSLLRLHSLVFDVKDFKTVYVDAIGCCCDEFYDNRHKFTYSQDIYFIDFIQESIIGLDEGGISTDSIIMSCINLIGDDLYRLTDGNKTYPSALVYKETAKLVDTVAVKLDKLIDTLDAKDENLKQMQDLIKQIIN